MSRYWSIGRLVALVGPLACAALITAGTASNTIASPRMVAAVSRALSVKESVTAALVNHKGATNLNERGHGSGTFRCPLTIQIAISYTRATITFTCATDQGVLSGRGTTAFYASGHQAHFNGDLVVTKGTGRYAHAKASKLHIVGTLVRGSYALRASVTGTLKF